MDDVDQAMCGVLERRRAAEATPEPVRRFLAALLDHQEDELVAMREDRQTEA